MKTQQRTSSSHQEGKIKHRAKQTMMAHSIRISFREKKKKRITWLNVFPFCSMPT